MIPKIIHLCWVQGDPPKRLKECIRSWIVHNQNYEVRQWSDEIFKEELLDDATNGINVLGDMIMNNYKNTPTMAHKNDIIRIYVMKKYGGVFTDMDMMCVKSIDEVMGEVTNPTILKLPWNSTIVNNIANMVDVGFVISPKNHPMWDRLIEMVEERIKTDPKNKVFPEGIMLPILYFTEGPKFNIQITPEGSFVHEGDPFTENTIAYHLGLASWKGHSIESFLIVAARNNPYLDIILIIMVVVIVMVAFIFGIFISKIITIGKNRLK